MKIDYNAIASQYSQHRKIHPGVLGDLLETSMLEPGKAVLDVGCGTGNYILAICAAVGCACYGLDPSSRMLEAARGRGGNVEFCQAAAENLPFPDNSFDLVFSVDVIHHLTDTAQFFREAQRNLRSGGRLCTVTDSEALIRSRVPLSRYFPETVEKELARYPSINLLRAAMQQAGFIHITEVIVRQPYTITDLGPFEAKAFSSLHLIPHDAWMRGLARMRADLVNGPIPAVSHYLLLWGEKK